MKQWRSLVALHSSAPSCFPQPPAPSPCPSPPREEEKQVVQREEEAAVRLVGSDGRVRTYRRPVTARELMQQHPRHLVCRSDALLIGEKIPAVAPGEELQPGHAYFLLPAHLFHSVLSFVSLASSLLLLLSTAGARGGNKKQRPFELLRTASGTLQIKFSDDFLLVDDAAATDDKVAASKPPVLCGDKKLEKEYEELVGYSKARRWSPKLETIQEVVVAAAAVAASASASADTTTTRRKGRGLPFLGRLGSRRRRETTTTTLVCGNGSAVACSG
ncbi:hypothetical protein E2562_033631 [Oryza meyeriana var. granulata]|uniref:DUF4228 domain-containing protein n=1 Tax=Oryza meyeriana var. granulata TaxID=110450 RepID=A0A6G1CA78_9ORYZ|nr:hypothetical protein E2562_033631 [Oryza meyeriana var. granulata]